MSAGLRVRHSARILGDLFSYARQNRAWWIIPLALILFGIVALGTASQAAVPYAVYTLF
jgi:hypothetical protein